MKLIILKNNLLEALSSVERAVGFSSNLSILKSILVKTDSNKAVFASTNLEIAVKHTGSCKVEKPGDAAVPFATLNNIVKNLSEEKITLNLKDRKLILSTDNYEAVLQTENTTDFPIIPEVSDKTKSVKSSGPAVREALRKALVATQYSEIRPEISGVLFRYRDDRLILAATDSFRLAEVKLGPADTDSTAASAEFILPLKAAEEFLRVFGENEPVQIFWDNGQILVKSEKRELTSRLIDGNFPDYEAIIPKETKNEVILDAAEFANSLKVTSVLAGRNNDIAISVGENKKFLEIYAANAAYGENRYRIPAKLKGGKFSVVFNWRYLLDGLKIYESENIILGLNSKDAPAVVKDPKSENQIYVLMPIKA